jgi:hypothetical protein
LKKKFWLNHFWANMLVFIGMINEYIIWRKVYKVDHQNGQFKILISAHTDGMFYGMVIYYTRTGDWRNDDIHLEMRHQNFLGRTEEDVYNQCIEWIRQNLPGRYNIELLSFDE